MNELVPEGQRSLRASDSDRQSTVDALGEAYADGRLTKAEFDTRADVAFAAKTMGDLVALTSDLGPSRTLARPVAATAPLVPSGPTRPLRLFAVFSGTSRQGDWAVPDTIQAVALFGGSKIDMSEATFTAPQVTIELVACFGGVHITVPPGTMVIDETLALFGGVDVKDVGHPVAGAPVVRLRGIAAFGGASVHASR